MTNQPTNTPSPPPPPRHRRDYFATAVEVAPPIVQSLGALAAAAALAVAGHRFVPDWAVYLAVFVSALVLLVSSMWSWRARHLIIDRAANVQRERPGRWAPDARRWLWFGSAAVLFLAVFSAYILHEGLLPSPSFASPYDGLDPQQSSCLDSAQKINIRGPVLYDNRGKNVGTVTLERSVNCSTVWARVLLDNWAVSDIKNDTINIIIERPGDNIKVPFSIALSGHDVAYGSMLSDSQSCVRAEVALRPNFSANYGKYSLTSCVTQR